MGGPSRSGVPGSVPVSVPTEESVERSSPDRSFHCDLPSAWRHRTPLAPCPAPRRPAPIARKPWHCSGAPLAHSRRSRKRPQIEQDTIAAPPGCPGAHARSGSATRETDGPLAVRLTEPQMSATNLHPSVAGPIAHVSDPGPGRLGHGESGQVHPGPRTPSTYPSRALGSQCPMESVTAASADPPRWRGLAALPRRRALKRLPPPNDVSTHRSSPGCAPGFRRVRLLVTRALRRSGQRRASSWRLPRKWESEVEPNASTGPEWSATWLSRAGSPRVLRRGAAIRPVEKHAARLERLIERAERTAAEISSTGLSSRTRSPAA
jgi:hypothetical protein